MSESDWGDARVNSGPWSGFYLYHSSDIRNRMNLQLRFDAEGVHGDGVDGIGEFVVSGRCDPELGKVWFDKTYLHCECCEGAHLVTHEGNADGNSIWGTWEFERHGMTGGFRIWPDAAADAEPTPDEAEREAPQYELAPVRHAIGFTGHSPFPEAI